MRSIFRRLLWVDACAAAMAGTLVLAVELSFENWLSSLYRLPHALLIFIGVANLLYACFSSSLAMRNSRTLPWVEALVAANLVWAAACIAMAWGWAGIAAQPAAGPHGAGRAEGRGACQRRAGQPRGGRWPEALRPRPRRPHRAGG
ncbi:MAG: hypothetical protein EOP39_21720, partial [Rubrivivax sp.]